MTIPYGWNGTLDKKVETGEEYAFVENMRVPNKTNPYRAVVQEVKQEGDMVRMDLKVTKPDPNKRYSEGQEITRRWHRQEPNSGTTTIYKHYEAGTNDYPDNNSVQFNRPEL